MRKVTVFKTTLLLFLLAQASPASFAQQDKTARATPYRIGVFPFAQNHDPGYGTGVVETQTADAVRTSVDDHPAFVVRYSSYDPILNAPRLRKVNRLWVGDAVRREPEVSLISVAARERNVDGVLICWLDFDSDYYRNFRPPKVEVYLVDVKSRKIYRAKGAQKNTTKLVDNVLAAFVEGRGEKLDIASISAEETPAQVEEKTRSTPYRIGVFPFEAYDPYSHWGSDEVIDTAVDAVQTFVDGHPALVLAYSYFDRMLNEPRLRKVNELWAGNIEKKPVVSSVSAAGRERNVDGVLMCWLRLPVTYGFDRKSVPAELYLIDVDSRKVYRAKGTNTPKLVDEVFSQFLDDHPKVTQ